MKILQNTLRYACLALLLCVSFIALPFTGKADQTMQTLLRAEGAFVAHSCGYYSATVAKLQISYWSPALSQDSKVFLHYGFEKPAPRNTSPQTIDWQQIDEVSLSPSSDPFDPMWRAEIEQQLHFRSSSEPFLTGLDFVIRVENPNGEVYYDKGNDSTRGFYRITWSQSQVACGTEFPAMRPLDISTVAR